MSSQNPLTVLLRRPVACGLIVGVLVLVLGCGYTFLRPTTYSATSVFSLVPRSDVAVSAATVQLIAASYVAYLSSPQVLEGVAGRTAESPAVVTPGTEVSLDPGSANIRIRATLPTAQQAAAVANAAAAAAKTKADADRLVLADPVSAALPEAAETNPPRRLLVTASALAAVLAGAVVAFVLTHRRPREQPRERRREEPHEEPVE